MAQRWAVATGNWSNPATWNGGTLPGATDDVYANNFTVTIDQDVTANSLNIVAGTTAVAGGTFQVTSGTRTVALQTLAVGAFGGSTSSQLLLLSGGSATITVAGAMSGDTTTAGGEPPTILASGGTHTITAGTCVGGAGRALEIGSATVTLTTDVIGGTGSANAVLLTAFGSVLTVHGSVTGGSSAVAVQVTLGTLRLDAELIYGPTGIAPVNSSASASGIVFMRDGANLAVTAPSDDDWPAVTGDPITLTASGGGGGEPVTPKRFLNVGGVATPIQ